MLAIVQNSTAGQKLGSGTTSYEERLILRHCGNAHPHLCDYFVRKHGFSDLCHMPYDSGSKSKLAHLRDLAGDLVFVMKNLKRIRAAREIIAMGPMAVNIATLFKLGVLPTCQRMYWFGLFVHNPKWLRILRYPFLLLDSERVQYVLFSEFEKTLYEQNLSLDKKRMYYVPYGDLSERSAQQEIQDVSIRDMEEDEFFFSGGYSNRDYASLIEVFRDLPYKLVIACSKLNTEINDLVVPTNITIVRDVPSEVFDGYVRASRACILPIAHDTGAAGQSSLLRFMQNAKVIIATDTGIVREYITDGISGILVGDNRRELSKAVREVATNIVAYKDVADAARERFVNIFSGEAIARKLDELMD